MMVMAPIFVLAVETGPTTQTDDGTVLGVMRELRKEVSDLRVRMDAMSMKIDQIGPAGDPALADSFVSDCVATCQGKGVECLRSSNSSSGSLPSLSAGAVPPTLITKENTCRRLTDQCVQTCHPPRVTVVTPSCETSCAVSMNACVRAAGNNTEAAERCRLANRYCLAEKCIKPTPTSLTVAAAKMPAGTCVSQCRRGYDICASRTTYDTQGLEECASVLRVCEQVTCKNDDQPIGTEITVQCENACTASFSRCQAAGNGDESKLRTCNSQYGSCRDACRQQVGGGAR
jgi:hypothetical protein